MSPVVFSEQNHLLILENRRRSLISTERSEKSTERITETAGGVRLTGAPRACKLHSLASDKEGELRGALRCVEQRN